ncbi:MAG: DUF885 domain-containing protein [Saccharofermentans sp.]|nr:DUF885 domain-containing protein [Saccharofermentans sp.]
MKKKLFKIFSLMLVLSVMMTAASCSGLLKKAPDAMLELEYTEFPTEKYNAGKVHPVRKSGVVTGQEAVNELSAIEWDYIRHYIGDDYLAASWCFSDLSAAGIFIDKPTLGKVGPGDYRGECEYLTGLLERLYRIDFENLDKQDRDFYDQIVFNIEEERYFNQYSGFHYMLPAIKLPSVGSFYLTVSYVDIRNRQEADQYIELLKDTDRYYDEVCEFEEKRSEKGYASIEAFYTKSSNAYYMLTQESQTEPFREMFVEKINALNDISEEEKAGYIEEFDKVMEEVVVPEFLECCKRIAALGRTNINDKGLAGFEHGKELYEHLLRCQIGRDCDVDKLAKELDKVLSMRPGENAAPVIEGTNNQEMMDIMTVKAEEYFPELDISYEIIKLPELFKAVGITGAYAARYFDDPSHEIIFLPDTVKTKEVVFHEGIPGHMYQYNYHKTHLRHIYMLGFAKETYIEGWATYIMSNPEGLYGVSGSGELSYTGAISRYYMAQARADICINYEGLTGKETTEYLSGFAHDIASVQTTDMFMTPGIGISYGLGCYMTLKTLETIRSLDPDMDLKTMHRLYLDAGPGCFDRILASVKREYA